VQHNPYGEDAVRLMVNLANRRPAGVPELVRRCRAAGLLVEEPAARDADMTAVHAFIDRWCDVVDATDERRRAELVNQMMAEAATHPRMTDHDGHWHLHFRDVGVPLHQQLRAWGSVGTALHLTGRGITRLGRCAVDDCTTIYADTSRTGRQRYCSTRCANRDAVRRHRARSSR
jgi:predicted RNA-binding Zn ribbon-like protein